MDAVSPVPPAAAAPRAPGWLAALELPTCDREAFPPP